MKVADMRLHLGIVDVLQKVELIDQENNWVFSVHWGWSVFTKTQAIAIAKRLCDRFNDGQGGK